MVTITWPADDWIAAIVWILIVMVPFFSICRYHSINWGYLKFIIVKSNSSTSIPIPTFYIFLVIWIFMMACAGVGGFIFWQLINSLSSLYVATMSLMIGNLVLAKFLPLTFFEMRSRWLTLLIVAICASAAAAVTVISGIEAHRQNVIVYTTTALWGVYTIWLCIVFLMMLPMTIRLELLSEIDKPMGMDVDYEATYKKKTSLNVKTKGKTHGSGMLTPLL